MVSQPIRLILVDWFVFHFCLIRFPFIFGPSGVRALPLAAGTNEGGHYFAYIFHFFLLLPPLFKTTEGVVALFQIFACGPELPIE